VLTIQRPERLNALSLELFEQLPALLADVESDRHVRVLVVRGAGRKAFAAGADIAEFEEQLGTPERAARYDETVERGTAALDQLGKPTIALIHGYALGSGILLAAACDLRYASEKARFAVPVARLGLMPSPPDLHRLVRLAGPAPILELILTGRQVGAAEALAMGLVNRVLAEEELDLVTMDIARRMTQQAPLSMRASKGLARQLYGRSAPPPIAEAADWYELVYGSRDVKEGARAFAEKREPRFEAR
jgi:enoyl-CoA hydratase